MNLFLVGSIILLPALAALAVIDARSFRLPDVLTLPLIAAGVLWHGVAQSEVPAGAIVGAAIGYGAFATLGWAFHRLRAVEGLGLGDAKLFAASGAWLGADALPMTALLAAGGALAFVLATRRVSGHIAFGPWLAAATGLMWLLR